jgi:hypothetical protein
LWDERFAHTVLLGAGLTDQQIDEVLNQNPQRLLERIGRGA